MPIEHRKQDYEKLDPRAFLRTRSVLWVINSKNPRAPLMKGNVLIPTRLIDFCHQKTQYEFFMGERCIKLNLQYWETMKKSKYKNGPPPNYEGTIYVNTPSIIEPYKGYHEEAKKVRNFALDKDNYLPWY